MGKFDTVIEKHTNLGVHANNIEYAISAIKDGVRREYILETLTADYRGMTSQQATELLEDLYAKAGGEFKQESRAGYLYGIFLLLIGFGASFYIFYVMRYGGKLSLVVIGCAIGGIIGGIGYILSAILGTHREEDSPF
ncbi:hypothetical protein [Xanthocytophaga agilis]|uniref:Uncharacterized protein n=1 Tax=Xanthocytophaga agilis TaxID=3048010 RepID=A0AAE3R3P3_9BACT|nr:hypothetical protein [Xanthocytophaga agilis]MDJ1500830.1 hypothetical protein [Xanthocytophaga agilis]